MEQFQKERLKICGSCEFLVADTCALCGCDVQEKTADAKQSCPLTPKKWKALVDVNGVVINSECVPCQKNKG